LLSHGALIRGVRRRIGRRLGRPRLVCRMIAAAAWVCTRCGSVISTSTRPASPSAVSNSARVSAPATHPVHCCMSARVTWSMSGSAITSESANSPPGRNARAASRSTVGLSAARLITQLETRMSTVASESGMSSRQPARNSALSTPSSSAAPAPHPPCSRQLTPPARASVLARPHTPDHEGDHHPQPDSRTRPSGHERVELAGDHAGRDVPARPHGGEQPELRAAELRRAYAPRQRARRYRRTRGRGALGLRQQLANPLQPRVLGNHHTRSRASMSGGPRHGCWGGVRSCPGALECPR
jgi:hypothetical protein